LRFIHALRSRLGLGAVAFLLLAIYRVQGKKMPDPLFNASVGILVVIGAAILISWAARPIAYIFRTYAVRIYRRDEVLAHQWLLDIATEHANSPQSFVRITERRIVGSEFDTRRPWVLFQVKAFNGTVHSLTCGLVSGTMRFDSVLFEDPVEEVGGTVGMSSGTDHDFQFRQYVRKEVAEEVKQAVTDNMSHRFNLDGLTLLTTPQVPNPQQRVVSIGGGQLFR
jgi:hypothetical protein